jgi:hypothetical protein
MSKTALYRAVAAALVGLGAAALSPPARLRAQSVEIVPYAGAALPLGKLIEQSRASIAHRPSLAFGGRLDVWLSTSLGLEVAVGYAPSGYHHVDTLGAVVDTSGGLFTATGRLRFRFAQAGRLSVHLVAGAGGVTHSGSYIAAVTGKSALAGVLGVAVRYRLSRGATLDLGVEDYVYALKLGGFGDLATPSSKLNNDVLFSLGLVVPLGVRDEDP